MKHVFKASTGQRHHFLVCDEIDYGHRVPRERGLGSVCLGGPRGSEGMNHREMKLPSVSGLQRAGDFGTLPIPSRMGEVPALPLKTPGTGQGIF